MANAPSAKRKARPKKRLDRRGTPKGNAAIKRPNGSKIGNPPFEPTDIQREKVLSHAAVGTPHEIIADEIGVSQDTLVRHFAKELAEGLPRANARLGGTLYKGALAGDTKKLEMWFDRRGGPEWQKKTGLELSSPEGQSIRHEHTSRPSDFRHLPIEKRRQLEQLLIEAATGPRDGQD